MEELEGSKGGGILAELLLPEVQYSQLDSFLKVFLVRWGGLHWKQKDLMLVNQDYIMRIRSSCEDVPGNSDKNIVWQL